MASIKILGGDFVVGGSGTVRFGVLSLPTPEHSFFGEKISLSKVMRVEAVNKEMKHRTGAAVGRGVVAAMIAGPIGSVFAVLGGPAGIAVAATSAVIGFNTTNHTSEVMFEAEFEGGRRLLATTDTATYTKLLAAAFDYKPPPLISPGVSAVPPPATYSPPSPWTDRGRQGAMVFGAFAASLLFFSIILKPQIGKQPQSDSARANAETDTVAQATKPYVAALVKCEDRQRDEDRIIQAGTGQDPVLFRRVLAQAPMVIASGNGTSDELARLSRLVAQWDAALAKWRAEHPCV